MPELPEVQAHVERLSNDFEGETLDEFRLLSFSALKTVQPSPDEAVGMSLLGFGRRGKLLLAHFGDAGDVGVTEPSELSKLTFVIHLMQAGRLIPDEKQSPRPKNGVARWTFGSGRALLLTEAGKEHKVGIWLMSGDPLAQAPLVDLGIDAASLSLDQLREALAAKNQRLHGFLRDQKGIAGIGRMLANEICHRAELSPFAMTRKLTDEDIVRLHQAIQDSIDAALASERALDAMSKSADRPARVHHRKGEPCPVCGDTIRAVEYNAYEVDYCPRCQTGGKVLADNTTSKFLK
ncbi:MAG: DNA-formamidopyrimidine glycosylase family protein [Microthrixaceae bacterium]